MDEKLFNSMNLFLHFTKGQNPFLILHYSWQGKEAHRLQDVTAEALRYLTQSNMHQSSVTLRASSRPSDKAIQAFQTSCNRTHLQHQQITFNLRYR